MLYYFSIFVEKLLDDDFLNCNQSYLYTTYILILQGFFFFHLFVLLHIFYKIIHFL